MQKLRRGFCTCVWNYIERTFDQQWMQSWSQATLISSSSRWARTKKPKKIRSPQTPYWEAPAKHTIPHLSWLVEFGVLSVGLASGWYQSACQALVGIYHHLHIAAPATKPVVWCAQFEQPGTQVLDPRRRSEIKKIKKIKEWPAAKSSSITHYHIYHLCCGDPKNNTDRWSASTSQLVLFNTPAALHQSIYMYLLGNLFER